MLKKRIEIIVTGETDCDIEVAFDEAVSRVKEGYWAGSDRNETGSYEFTVHATSEG